ncbi:PBP1A family penicillin-binding protein [bacterium 3DAC]|nr:PBP1A family penicillin-binding protein [Dictyoglomota bacterium]UZN22988.1 PBP1A family penicillin-binding protein [bacterium 3DAC]
MPVILYAIILTVMGRKNKQTSHTLKKFLHVLWSIAHSLILVFIIISLSLVLAASAIAINIISEYSMKLPDPKNLQIEVGKPSVIYDRNGTKLITLGSRNKYVPLNEISPYLKKAVIAVEDHYFYEHPGVSIKGLLRAIYVNIRYGGVKQGASTITQQLARTIYNLGMEKHITRKIKEAILAVRLEQRYTKDEILEMYLNTVYLGAGCYGVGCASLTYFGKSTASLTLSEAAMLAGIINSPSALCPLYNYNGAWERAKVVLQKMYEYGYITKEQYEEALKNPPKIQPYSQLAEYKDPSVNYFLTYIIPKLIKKFGEETIYKGGLKIYTTLDVKIQESASTSLKYSLKYFREKWLNGKIPYDEVGDKKIPQPQGAIVVIDPKTGDLLAMIGGEDFNITKFNRAIAKRQTGSAIKPIIYATALDYKISMPGDYWESKPLELKVPGMKDQWSPKEFNGKYWGWISMREALIESSNPVTVQIGMALGLNAFRYRAQLMGIQTEIQPYLSSFLGATDLSPIEMAYGYAPFANGGKAVVPRYLLKVIDNKGNTIWQSKPSAVQVLSPDAHYLAVNLLEDVFKHKIYAKRLNKDKWELGGKTGTTDEKKNAWFIGFGGDFVASVYIGLDKYDMKLPYKARTFMMGPGIAAYTWGTLLGELETKKLFPGSPIPKIKEENTDIMSLSRCKPYGERDNGNNKDIYLVNAAPEGNCVPDSSWLLVGVDFLAGTYTFPECDEFSMMTPAMVPYEQLQNMSFVCNISATGQVSPVGTASTSSTTTTSTTATTTP